MMEEEIKKNEVELDFPFYNDNPKIKIIDIIILAITPILFTIYCFIPYQIFPSGTGPYIFCFVQLIAFLYVARGNISLLIKKPKVKDFVRVIITVILAYVFSISVSAVIQYGLKIQLTANDVVTSDKGVAFWFEMIFQLFGEELYKILVFLVVLIIIHKLTKKRTFSIVIATTVSLFCFAIMHYTTYNNFLHIILLQGVGSLFCMYNYLKSKNILTSYLQHLLFDFFPIILFSAISLN